MTTNLPAANKNFKWIFICIFSRNGNLFCKSEFLRWQDIIFENGFGSIKTTDSLFRKRYGRAYFNYKIDSLKHSLEFTKSFGDTSSLLSMRYEIPDSNTVWLWVKLRNDSLFIVLRKTNRHFQLTERQFHWLSESNR